MRNEEESVALFFFFPPEGWILGVYGAYNGTAYVIRTGIRSFCNAWPSASNDKVQLAYSCSGRNAPAR